MNVNYACELIEQGADSRRLREQAAVARLIDKHIGKNLRLGHRPDGSPFIEGVDINISISHSRHYAALAWSPEARVGIDIEELRPGQLARVSGKFLSRVEAETIGDDPLGLLRVWTLKEAAFKAVTDGPADLRLYEVGLADGDSHIAVGNRRINIVLSQEIEPGVWMSIVRVDGLDDRP